MAGASHYPIRGGIPGRERLRLLSRVMRPSTIPLLERAGIAPGMACLDAGCGGGDVAFEMARMVTPGGHVVGTDIDDTKLEIARNEATALGLPNAQFLHADALRDAPGEIFDLVHARFLLSHLSDPASALENFHRSLRPGGVLVIEDVDFSGHFCYPADAAFDRYIELYRAASRRKGGDADIGPRLPELVADAGFGDIQVSVAQHASNAGDVKFLTALTMENIVDAVVHEGLIDRDEADRLAGELYDFGYRPDTICSTPRIFEVRARRG